MRRSGVLPALLLTIAVAGCDDGLTGVTDGVVRAVPVPPTLTIQNRSDEPVHYFVVEVESAALIDWLACAGPPCPAIAGGASLDLPFAQIAGWAPGEHEVIVHWWRAVPSGLPGGGFVADSIRSLRVSL